MPSLHTRTDAYACNIYRRDSNLFSISVALRFATSAQSPLKNFHFPLSLPPRGIYIFWHTIDSVVSLLRASCMYSRVKLFKNPDVVSWDQSRKSSKLFLLRTRTPACIFSPTSNHKSAFGVHHRKTAKTVLAALPLEQRARRAFQRPCSACLPSTIVL